MLIKHEVLMLEKGAYTDSLPLQLRRIYRSSNNILAEILDISWHRSNYLF